MKKIFVSIIFVLFILECSPFVTEQERDKNINYKNSSDTFLYNAVPHDGSADITDRYKDGINNFSVNLLDKLYSSTEMTNKNIVISPFSISRNLSTVAEGCSTNAKSQIVNVLGGEGTLEDAKMALSELLYADDSIIFQSADALYFDKNKYTLKDGFKESIKTNYGVYIEGADFTDISGTVSIINDWISTNTAGYITDYLNADDITEESVGFVFNAVYFKAAWTSPFDATLTYKDTFHSSTVDVSADFMVSDYQHQISNRDNYDNAVIYYGKNEKYYFYLDIYMPTKISMTDFIENELVNALNEDKATSSTLVYGSLKMPKFDFITNTDLTPILKDMGITDIFDYTTTPVTNMFNENDPLYPFYIQRINHRAGIKTDEEGTVAFAVTESDVWFGASGGPSDEVFLNRPFVYCIRAGSNGLVLFAGVVENPLLND